jgi:hypothetical protein
MKIECCICGELIEEMLSNNARPVEEGRCCERCNTDYVIPARFALLKTKDEGAQ